MKMMLIMMSYCHIYIYNRICSDSIFNFKNVNKVCWKLFSVLTSAVKRWVPIVSIPFVACARLVISSVSADCLINQAYV